jgi:pyrimidine-nucleoside phosphorylase
MRAVDFIARKRDGYEHSREELEWFVKALVAGEISDYQTSAWLMAVVLRGMTASETADLTRAMAFSGMRLDLTGVAPFVADKHSTGGVGDKTTLVVAPLVAAAGVPVGKMSGRGLGFSGGTIDKLESISGFRTSVSTGDFIRQVKEVGIVVAAQTPDLAPADGILYKLRDVTATVDSLPLIASSIMSKKIAAGATGVILDVKAGKGAFMKTVEDARSLAEAMRDIGGEVGLQVRAVISDMDQPLGWAVGNALEVNEAVQTLKGEGPEDLLEVALALGGHLLHMAAKTESPERGAETLLDLLHAGVGLRKFREFIVAQGGDPAFVDRPELLPQAPVQHEVAASGPGYLAGINAEAIGRASVTIGAGRATKEAAIDYSVGFVLHAKVGDRVSQGQLLATIHAANDVSAREIESAIRAAFQLSNSPQTRPPTIREIVT